MPLAIVYSRAPVGISAPLVTVEVHISPGMAGLNIVGLPEATVKESKDRVRSALLNTHFEFPAKRITINLAPADLPKEGGRFDLPIALGILAASRQLPSQILLNHEFVGELALSGEVRPVRGVLPIALSTMQTERQLIVPQANAAEAAIVEKTVWSAKHLLEVCAYLKGELKLARCQNVAPAKSIKTPLDLIDVKGQLHAKRALTIAAAGKHNLLLIGPPGTGKTMLAQRLPSILPPLTQQAAQEVAAIASVSSNGFDPREWQQVPFRAPHHSTSSIALVGGGRPPRPGEISLAHHGVLFLDELPEFNRHVLECLREPLESGFITISRAAYQTLFPAQFQLIAAMNPCPCGYAGSGQQSCQCSHLQIKRYLARISGPLLERIDMHVQVPRISPDILAEFKEPAIASEVLREKVKMAALKQMERQGKYNHFLSVTELTQFGALHRSATQLLKQIVAKFNFSARVYHRLQKVARTIADLEDASSIHADHVSEAITLRSFLKS